MSPLNLGVISRTALTSKADFDAQGQQPQMQLGWKRRWRGVIVKDCPMIEGDATGQASGQEGSLQHERINVLKKEFCTLRKLDRFLMRYFLIHNRRSSAVSLIAALLAFWR